MENEVRMKVVPRSKRVAFTGYRPQKMPFGFDEQDERCVDFKKRLHDTIESFIWQGYQHFISGGALGMDMYAAEAVLDMNCVRKQEMENSTIVTISGVGSPPISPTAQLAISLPAPVLSIAVDTGIIPANRKIVTQSIEE